MAQTQSCERCSKCLWVSTQTVPPPGWYCPGSSVLVLSRSGYPRWVTPAETCSCAGTSLCHSALPQVLLRGTCDERCTLPCTHLLKRRATAPAGIAASPWFGCPCPTVLSAASRKKHEVTQQIALQQVICCRVSCSRQMNWRCFTPSTPGACAKGTDASGLLRLLQGRGCQTQQPNQPPLDTKLSENCQFIFLILQGASGGCLAHTNSSVKCLKLDGRISCKRPRC